MKRYVALSALAALAIGLGAGAASAQKVADFGFSGMDPRSGKAPKQVVIFFHGYTQKGVAMKPLADTLAKRLPDAAFIFNDGPLTQGDGRSWHVLRGEDTENTRAAVKKLAVDTVTKASEGLKVPHDKIVVVGFSQGGGVAFDAGSCSTPDVKAVVSLAGILANGDCTKEAAGTAAEVLIIHNDGDPTVKADRIQAFQEQLKKDGYESRLETVAGASHWPAPEGLIKAQDFIVKQLGG
ncbi:MAG TPA: dienelactone hydrolase family protein [Hyphomonadaceae bacterium]|jgi:phospholipase/carboxylesterase|nr:dienelactone hydrolase family protein [Hyphomonadaceae bacterium]HPN05495.1 dienelactone hydrolase family protein [Hyphomonadaceae bacterium]